MTDVPVSETPADLKRLMHELESGMQLRIQEVAADNARLRRLVTIFGMVAGVLAALAAILVIYTARRGLPGTVAQSVESRSFIVRGEDGSIRGALGVDDQGALKLSLQGASGRAGIELQLLADGSQGLVFSDSAGLPRLVLGLLPDQTGTLVFGDAAGRTRASLGVAPDGSSSLALADRNGETRAGLGLNTRGEGTFTLAERPGASRGPSAASTDTAGRDTAQ